MNCRATDLHAPTVDHLDRVEELSKHDAGRQPDEWIQRPLQRAVSFPESAPGLPNIGPRLPHGSAAESWWVVAEMILVARELHRETRRGGGGDQVLRQPWDMRSARRATTH